MSLEFTIFTVFNPAVFGVMLVLMAVLVIVWIAKWIVSLGTGAGGN